MFVRFFIDPETERPHVEQHGVTPSEAVETLVRAKQDFAGYGGARIAIGPTTAGRIVKVIYRPDEAGDGVFIITAYPVQGNELKAYRRRTKRK